MVVRITMITTAEKVALSTMLSPATVNPRPIFAKMRPTSPRGIMPIPIDSRSTGRPSVPSAHNWGDVMPTLVAVSVAPRKT